MGDAEDERGAADARLRAFTGGLVALQLAVTQVYAVCERSEEHRSARRLHGRQLGEQGRRAEPKHLRLLLLPVRLHGLLAIKAADDYGCIDL